MSLVSPAESAEAIGAGFTKFLDPVSDHATEITALVSDLFALSSVLRDLDASCLSRQYGSNFPLIADDLKLVRSSLCQTLKDALNLLGDIDHAAPPTSTAYYQTWKRIHLFFRREYGDTLGTHLERYKKFLVELGNVVKRNNADLSLIQKLRGNIDSLWQFQSDRMTEGFGGIALGPRPRVLQYEEEERAAAADRLNAHRRAGPTPRRSYERPRPVPVQSPGDSDSPQSPQSSTWSREGVIPPFVPEAPSSPTTTSTTTTTSTSQSSNSTTTNPAVHWAMRVFEDDAAATPLPRSNERSKCYGQHMPTAKARLAEEYDELFQLSFGGGSELSVRLFRREEDHRSRILCKIPSSRGSTYCCLPLNNLEIVRSESCLQVCRKTRTKDELELWANLRFSTFERMVLFYCTFIALRAHDCGRPVSDIRDYELSGETELYGGQIVDDNFLHALRIFKDKSTKAVRLQASVHRGELKRTPVWTAFITHHLLSNTWLRQVSSKTIHLSELRRTVFSPEYTPQRTARGEHVLSFTTPEDAENFIDVLASIKGHRRR